MPKKSTDDWGESCYKSEQVELEIGGVKKKICWQTRQMGLENANILKKAFKILSDSERINDMLSVLSDDENEELYSAEILKDFDLLP